MIAANSTLNVKRKVMRLAYACLRITRSKYYDYLYYLVYNKNNNKCAKPRRPKYKELCR